MQLQTHKWKYTFCKTCVRPTRLNCIALDHFVIITDKSTCLCYLTGEADWYGILSVNPHADDDTVELALMLHPDKN